MVRRRTAIAAAGVIVVVVAVGCSWLFRGRPVAAITSFAACTTAGYLPTDTNPPACTANGRTFLGPTATPTPSAAAVTNLPFDLLVDGDSTGSYPKRQQVVHTEVGWKKYWSQVHAALPMVPPILPVNFNTNDVIALSEGRQPTTGYVLKITGVNAGANGTAVDVIELVPTLACHGANTPSNRYYIIRTPKLTMPVSFRITTVYRSCP